MRFSNRARSSGEPTGGRHAASKPLPSSNNTAHPTAHPHALASRRAQQLGEDNVCTWTRAHHARRVIVTIGSQRFGTSLPIRTKPHVTVRDHAHRERMPATRRHAWSVARQRCDSATRR